MERGRKPDWSKIKKKRVKGTHYLYVKFKPAFQNPCEDKTYQSYDLNGSTENVEKGLNRLLWLYNTNKDRYLYAKIAHKATSEVIREYRCPSPKTDNTSSICLKASVILKPQAAANRREETGKELVTLTGNWNDTDGKADAAAALEQVYIQLREGKWKDDYVQATLYKQPENKKIGKIDEEGNITIYESTIYNDINGKFKNLVYAGK